MEIKCQLDATDDFYCRSYCLLNMFRAPLCPSTGVKQQLPNGHITLSSTPYRQLENQAPNTTGSDHLCNTLELLMMGIVVPETCWASSKICNKNSSVAPSWHFISTTYIVFSTSHMCWLQSSFGTKGLTWETTFYTLLTLKRAKLSRVVKWH